MRYFDYEKYTTEKKAFGAAYDKMGHVIDNRLWQPCLDVLGESVAQEESEKDGD